MNSLGILRPFLGVRKVAVALALIVGLLICQAALAAATNSYEAESFSLPSGASVVSDSAASGGKAVKFTANGTATKSVSITSSATTVVVVARGPSYGGMRAELEVKLDGVDLLPNGTRLRSDTYERYEASRTVAAGNHTLSIRAEDATSSRPLYADVYLLEGESDPSPPPSDSDGDGVLDAEDNCPNESGPASDGGCPEPPPTSATLSGELKKWHPITLSFTGPSASETSASPNNPFLDYRLQVTFTGPSGQRYVVPGFFDGDGHGGATGNVWRARFAPDQAGTWTYQASFRKGSNVAIDLSSTAGSPTGFDGTSGTFAVAERDPAASGFLKWGRLEYVGKHYLKFRDGSYWLKGGADSPENWLGYSGFDNTPRARHTFSPHVRDWQTGNPLFNTSSADGGKGLIGAMNYLSSQGVNSIYFLPMNVGGDGKDTSPYVNVSSWAGSTSNDNRHFDISKLRQWESAFAYAQRKGIHLHFVLSEAEEANKRELDNATLGVQRKLFYRELVARFGHHNALQWNVSEEYDYKHPLSPAMIKAFAGYIQQTDPYDHPITVHQQGNPDTTWAPFLGDSRFSMTSLQYAGSVAGYGSEVEQWRLKTASAGRALPISMDELATATPTNADQQRKAILWPTYLSGGQLEWFAGPEDQSLEDFRRYQGHWTYTRYARTFMKQNLPFWEMAPQDGLLSGESSDYGGGQVFAKAGQVYAVYLPNATSTGVLDLISASGSFQKRWYNPRTGQFEGVTQTVSGGGKRSLGTPPSSPSSDWVVLIKASG